MAIRRLYTSFVQQVKINSYCINRTYHKLFVRYPILEEDKITLEFDFPQDILLTNKKHFSFIRSKDEDINHFLNRLKTKVNVEFEKYILKKNKKTLKKVDLNEVDFTGYVIDNASLNHLGSNIDINGNTGNSLCKCFVENTILKLNDTEYVTIINAPLIISLKLPKVIVSNCPVIPIVKLEYGSLADFQFEWFVSMDAIRWKSIHHGIQFTPSSEYELHHLRVVGSNNETQQSISSNTKSFIFKCPAQEALQRRWLITQTFVEDTDKVRLMTYNMLADVYSDTELAKTELFRHCPLDYLAIGYRQHLLARELSAYHCDIICLQEVDNSLYTKWWQPFLAEAGYDGIMVTKNGLIREGQAIFWRRSKLTLIRDISLPSLSELMLNEKMTSLSAIRDWIRSNGDEMQRWLEMRQCMAGCVLETMDGQQLMVATSHLFFRPDSPLVRLFQMAAIIGHIEATKLSYPRARVVICGDFNDSRGSPVIDFIENAKTIVTVDSRTMDIHHNSSLTSAYDVQPFTNYVVQFSGELDFIFYDREKLSCQRTIPLPSLDEVTENVALPNKDFPSDHLALIAELKMI